MVNYPTFSNKYIDGLPLEIDTHRHFWISKQISEPVCILLYKNAFIDILIIFVISIYIVIYMYSVFYLCLCIYLYS